jgi:co-chaperonin GroES (HSP10)
LTDFGLVLPSGHDRGLSHEGTVVMLGVGPRWDGKKARFDAKVGDRIVYSTRIDTREVNGEEFDLVENDSIIGTLQ